MESVSLDIHIMRRAALIFSKLPGVRHMSLLGGHDFCIHVAVAVSWCGSLDGVTLQSSGWGSWQVKANISNSCFQ